MSVVFHSIGAEFLSLSQIQSILSENKKLMLSDESSAKIESCRAYLDTKIEQSVDPIYGINTGFGSLCDTEISSQDLRQLQVNLVRSHACGLGEEVPNEIVKLMLLLKIQGLSQGHSGVKLDTVERLIAFYNANVTPVVYKEGSLGASGDLAPLAHLALPLLGEGEVNFEGRRMPSSEINKQHGWKPIELASKEGLALLNGTQFMSAYATFILLELDRLTHWADLIAAASIDAYDGSLSPFHPLVHEVRPHKGQKETAAQILNHLHDSEIARQKKTTVQDPYCLRCIPQVHGATKDTIDYARGVVEIEINAVTDNPTIFEKEEMVISAGNFHGQPLALVLDFLAISTAEIASISERRVYKLLGGKRGLPPFLVNNPGLNSGFMIVQYAAASIVSQNKQLATPASVDTIDSSNGQEDHVSMGANAATKLFRVLENLEKVLSIEWLTACQALDFRDKASSTSIEALKSEYRQIVPFVDTDMIMQPLFSKSIDFIKSMELRKL
ncbi:MAG: histidine ammonia-lyase [Verrucomicrobia bacterium]|nr:histidine ammonia-lyase [Verrucomicrobiota bacterium]